MASGEVRILINDAGTTTALQRKLSYLLGDVDVRKGITSIVRDEVNKFVPRETGTLAGSAEINDDEIVWTAPYAHYQYVGQVYGPNFPVIIDDESGWRSPRGKPKYATGQSITYHTPGTTNYWDVAMMQDSNARRIMNFRITAYLKRMAKEKNL